MNGKLQINDISSIKKCCCILKCFVCLFLFCMLLKVILMCDCKKNEAINYSTS
uniref:Uncharacterized protein n=1 Tax=Anguilla anguilla TaxID=7936 RepID=A0A0E9SEI9_ANGAN